MDDTEIRARIETLESEEKRLRAQEGDAAESDHFEVVAEDRRRLDAIKIELDQLWDLLRQRQALRGAGENPDEAQLRDPGTVEDYLG
jgi:hypothetical protein